MARRPEKIELVKTIEAWDAETHDLLTAEENLKAGSECDIEDLEDAARKMAFLAKHASSMCATLLVLKKRRELDRELQELRGD